MRKYHTDLPDYGAPVKISHVMTTVAGAPRIPRHDLARRRDARSPISAAEVSKLMRGQPDLNFEPGERLMYCNTGFRLRLRDRGEGRRRLDGRTLLKPAHLRAARPWPTRA